MLYSSNLANDTGLSTRSDTESVDPSLVQPIILTMTIEMYFHAVTVAILLYDSLITFDREVRYYWKVPRKPVDFVYFTNRYVGILNAISDMFSFTYHPSLAKFILVMGGRCYWYIRRMYCSSILLIVTKAWITITSIDYILMIRVLALYSNGRMVSIVLKMLLACESISVLVLDIYVNLAVHHKPRGVTDDTTVCGEDPLSIWQLGLIAWVIPLAYAAVLLALALYKASEYWRLSEGFKGFTLIKVLIEDQIIYFLLALLCYIFNILSFKVNFSNNYVAELFVTLGDPGLLCVLGSRMLFNLKEAGERGQNVGTSYRNPSVTLSEIEFASSGEHKN